MTIENKKTYELIKKIESAGRLELDKLWTLEFKYKPSGELFSSSLIKYAYIKSLIRNSISVFNQDEYEKGYLVLNENGKNYLKWMAQIEDLEKQNQFSDLQIMESIFGETALISDVPENFKELLYIARYINAQGKISTDRVDFDSLLRQSGFSHRASTYDLEKMGIITRTKQPRQNKPGKYEHFLSVSDEQLAILCNLMTPKGHLGKLAEKFPDKTPKELSFYNWCSEKKRHPFEWQFQMTYLDL